MRKDPRLSFCKKELLQAKLEALENSGRKERKNFSLLNKKEVGKVVLETRKKVAKAERTKEGKRRKR